MVKEILNIFSFVPILSLSQILGQLLHICQKNIYIYCFNNKTFIEASLELLKTSIPFKDTQNPSLLY